VPVGETEQPVPVWPLGQFRLQAGGLLRAQEDAAGAEENLELQGDVVGEDGSGCLGGVYWIAS